MTVTANPDADAYQRLRGHLAYLKLNAAIEALPALLDEARDQGLPVLDALERLMGAEADAAQARKLASRLHWAALPAPWRIERLRLRRPARRRPRPHPRARHPAVPRRGREHSLHRPPGSGQDDAVGRPGPRRRRGRAQGPVHHLRGHDPPAAPRDRRAPLRLRPALLHLARGCSSSTSSATASWTRRPAPCCSRSSTPATSRAASSPRPTSASRPGPSGSATPCSPPPHSTACCTGASSPRSTGRPTGCAPTSSAPTPSARPQEARGERRAAAMPVLRRRVHLDPRLAPQAVLLRHLPPPLVELPPPPGPRRRHGQRARPRASTTPAPERHAGTTPAPQPRADSTTRTPAAPRQRHRRGPRLPALPPARRRRRLARPARRGQHRHATTRRQQSMTNSD